MRDAAYWRQRSALLEASAHKNADESVRALEDLYQETQREVRQEIESWYARFARDNQLTLAEAKKRLTAGEMEEFRWSVEQYVKVGKQAGLDPAWQKKLANASVRFHISRLEAIELQIQQQIELLYGNQVDEVDELLRKVVGEGYTHTAFEVQKGLGAGWDIAALDPRKLDALLTKPWSTDHKTFLDRCWTNKEALVGEVSKRLTQGLLRGDAPAKTIAAIQKTFGVHRYKAARLVHTETTYFNAVASRQAYQDLDVEQVEIIETLDGRTCEICGDMDGKIIPLSQYEPGVTVPPYHPNCRGTTAPAIDAKWAGKRLARDGEDELYEVPADMTYAQWKAAFVDGGPKNRSTAANRAGDAKPQRDYTTEFGRKLGKDYYDQIRDRVDACQSADLRTAWDKYEGKIKIAEAAYQGGAYCQGDNIYVNIAADAQGRFWSAPYATTFHESGHAMDGLAAHLGSPNGLRYFSSTYKDGAFPKTIKDEVNDWVNRVLADMKAHKDDFSYWVRQGWMDQNTAAYYTQHGGFKVKKAYAYAAVQAEVRALTPLQYGDLSDILEGATHGKIQCGIGHGGGSYWAKRVQNGVEYGLGTEAFAEMTSATMTSPESLATIKKYLPRSYAMYEDMIKEIASQP